jgi:hypothetical protein
MSERPILFSAPMVLALLAGTKTQTRRLVKPQPVGEWAAPGKTACPYGVPGDRLWVRETWQYSGWTDDGEPFIRYRADNLSWLCETRLITDDWAARLLDIWAGLSDPDNYKIDDKAADRRWRPAIHMPRFASRINLVVTAVRIERLHDITNADAEGEGCRGGHGSIPGYGYSAMPVEHFRDVWRSINGADSWDGNPLVWVVSFNKASEGKREVET